jgi:hypothetical protein
MQKSSFLNFILLSLLASMFFIACKKDYDLCEGQPDIEIKYRAVVGADAMKLYPYKGNETLTFISNKGDTAVLVGKGQLFKYPKLRYSGNNDCTNFYHEHEITFAEYVGTNPKFNQLRLEIFKGKYSSYLDCHVYANYSRGFGDYWDAKSFYALYNPPIISQQIQFRDSLVNANIFYLGSNINEFPKALYFRQFGVVAYLPDSNTKFTLK